VFGIYRCLPSNWSDINAIKGINATRFAKGTSPEGFCPIDEKTEAFEPVYNVLYNFSPDYDVITEHKHSTGLMKPKALQYRYTYSPED
jgi:hypothetical protein